MIAPAFLLAGPDRPCPTFLRRPWFRLRLQGLRIEADIEHVIVGDGAGWRRVDQIVGHQRKRLAAPFAHGDGGLIGLGGDGLLGDAALDHGNAQRHLHCLRRAGRPRDHASLDADPRRDLRAVDRAFARGAGDRRLEAQIVADRLLARCRHGIGGGAGTDRHRRTAQIGIDRGLLRRRRIRGRLFGLAAEQALEAIAQRLRRRRRSHHGAAEPGQNRGRDRGFDQTIFTHTTSLTSCFPAAL